VALRSPALWMGNPAVQHTAQNDRLMLAGLHRPETGQTATNRPLTAAGGVVAGPAGTMGEVTLLSNTQFTVNPARWVVPSTASALHGVYKVQNDAVSTLGITAQNATQFRRSYFGVWVIDSFVAGSGDDLPHWGLVDGALAASAVAATLPSGGTLPANFLALGEFLIPPVGQTVTWTPYDVRTGLRGGILPVTATDTRAPANDGQYRDHPTRGLERGAGGAWVAPVRRDEQAVGFGANFFQWDIAPFVELLRCWRMADGQVKVQGMARSNAALTAGTAYPFITMPSGFWPGTTVIRHVIIGTAVAIYPARVDTDVNGVAMITSPITAAAGSSLFIPVDYSYRPAA
jgi:hypothetical protein